MIVDDRVRAYFDGRVKQVFIYLTNRCQLRCRQCLYKPLLDNNSIDLDYMILLNLLEVFYGYGARKLSFLGGEPTLYHDKKNDKRLGDIILAAKKIGYEYIRIDTNGQFQQDLLTEPEIELLDEITFSVDGHSAEINDNVRGNGTFIKSIKNIEFAISCGYKVQITSCVHAESCPTAEIGIINVDKMILFAQSLGIHSINFHPIVKVGIARDAWIDDTNIDPLVWVQVYKTIEQNIRDGAYDIAVRIPMRFEQSQVVAANPDAFLYCPLQLGERALIMPDGQIKVCAFTIGTNQCVARFSESEIVFESAYNETSKLNCGPEGVCYHQTTAPALLTPLCMSFKPNQDEFVWNNIGIHK